MPPETHLLSQGSQPHHWVVPQGPETPGWSGLCILTLPQCSSWSRGFTHKLEALSSYTQLTRWPAHPTDLRQHSRSRWLLVHHNTLPTTLCHSHIHY